MRAGTVSARMSDSPELLLMVDQFPALSETFVAAEAHALVARGKRLRIESGRRASEPNEAAAQGLEVRYLEDDPRARKLADFVWLVARHPAGSLADLIARRRWRREEPVRPLRSLAPMARRAARSGVRHVHAHFAAAAALDALRLSRLRGTSWSVTAHAYDIFQAPRNLAEKLESADFATTGCDYNVEHLRGLVGPEAAVRIHRIVMGVDGERFRRESAERADGRAVIAVGRLVEKKGFEHLLEAAARMGGRIERLTIVGEGPLRARLERQIAALGLEGTAELAGARKPDEVRALLERHDVLAMPSVVAPDGDRDSMPVVVKEALAMELPVVASDEVGLPEVVRPEWGRLVPPANPGALAEAIDELLSLSADERARMGAAGREFVLRECDVNRETERLDRLLEKAMAGRSAAGLRDNPAP
jgi:colanic acid/amylovoran biosynthesis glycosyltransferase